MSAPRAKRGRQTLGKAEEALGDAVRNALAALPHYSRYCQTRRVTLKADDPVCEYLASSFVASATRHRGPAPRDPHREAPKLEVSRIEKIFTPRLQEAYLAELNNTAGLCERKVTRVKLPNAIPVQSFEGLELNEYLLYHGAPSSMIRRFTEQGLDPRYAGTHFGKLFGNGTYFASHSSKSDIYTEPNADGERCVLVVRTCLGEPHYEKTDRARREAWLKPPERPDGRGPLSSLIAVTRQDGGCVEHPEFVVYKDTHSLPQYAIWYKHSLECKCTHCWLTSKISVVVTDADGSVRRGFEVRRSEKLQVLLDSIALRSTLPRAAPRKYMYKGTELTGEETPQDLDMEDEASIIVIGSRPDNALNVKVVTQDGNEVFFKCKPTTPLGKLMTAFCNRQGVSLSDVRFMFDGAIIGQNQTPEELEMDEDGDVIDVFVNSSHATSDEGLNVKVVTQDGNEVFFKMKLSTPMQKLMTAFCNRQGVSLASVRFLFDGARINEDQTPKELEMEDGDVIEVILEM